MAKLYEKIAKAEQDKERRTAIAEKIFRIYSDNRLSLLDVKEVNEILDQMVDLRFQTP